MAPRKRRASNEDDPDIDNQRVRTRTQKRVREEEEAQRLIAAGTGEYHASRTQFNHLPFV